jgi:N-acylneuraminate cytidylyltransferase
MKALGLICARGGSKGLPGKNIKMLAGKPLIAWAIEHAKAVKRIERVLVSTDSQEIAEIARQYGAEVPFMRPEALAQDHSPEWLVWRHALKFVEDSWGVRPDVLVCVPVTAPLRLPIDIENCLDEYEKSRSDIVISVTDAHRSPYFNMVKTLPDGFVELVLKSEITRRQDAPVVYDMTTVSYVADPEFVLTKNGLFEGRVSAVHVPVERALDIDTPFDFKIAEFLKA